jgi:hypothetical protein
MVIPCEKGGWRCSWPACPLECPGRHPPPSNEVRTSRAGDRVTDIETSLLEAGETWRSASPRRS